MVNGIVLDSNVINYYFRFEDNNEGEYEDYFNLIEMIIENKGIVFTRFTKAEWEQTNGHQRIKTWLTKLYREKPLRIEELEEFTKIENRYKNHLKNTLGFPNDDRCFIDCAYNTNEKYIFTNDIDFFNPKEKDSDETRKLRIKNNRNSPVCKYLREKLHITVGICDHCRSHFFPE
jgi:rRNA-processing protein FCF1